MCNGKCKCGGASQQELEQVLKHVLQNTKDIAELKVAKKRKVEAKEMSTGMLYESLKSHELSNDEKLEEIDKEILELSRLTAENRKFIELNEDRINIINDNEQKLLQNQKNLGEAIGYSVGFRLMSLFEAVYQWAKEVDTD